MFWSSLKSRPQRSRLKGSTDGRRKGRSNCVSVECVMQQLCWREEKRKRRMKAAIQSHLVPIESTLCYLHLQYTVMMRMWFNGTELNNFGWRVGSQTQFHPIAKGKGSSLQTHHFPSPPLQTSRVHLLYNIILSLHLANQSQWGYLKDSETGDRENQN